MRESYDVIVAGGGVAGIAAAAAAARHGATTLLVEKSNALGGTPFTVFHRFICGLYNSDATTPATALNGGMIEGLCEALHRSDPDLAPQRMGKVHVLPFKAHALRMALLGLLPPASHLDVRLDTEAVSACFPDVHTALIALRHTANSGEPRIVKTKTVIDCSGDGALIQSCGAAQPMTPQNDLPYAGYSILFSDIDAHDPDLLAIKVPMALHRAVAARQAPIGLQFTVFQPGDTATEGVCKLSLPPNLPPETERAVAQDAVARVLAVLRTGCAEFKNASVAATSPHAVQRESARLLGQYTLTADDVLDARSFPDSAARNAWPIELWLQNTRPAYRYVKPGWHGDIPAQCLQSKRFPNLWAAGRCLSATSEALASCRVVGVCIPLGETAGTRAAQYALERRA